MKSTFSLEALAKFVRAEPRTVAAITAEFSITPPCAAKKIRALTGDGGKPYRVPGEQLVTSLTRQGKRGPKARAFHLRLNSANAARAAAPASA